VINFNGSCKFIISAVSSVSFPKLDLCEFTFIGRSNVGKSSLINILVLNNKMARVSQNPGCTRSVNFFSIDDVLLVTDLPGYGFSKFSKKSSKDYMDLVFVYLESRNNLKCVYVLIDSRRSVDFKDLIMLDVLESLCIKYQIILTKSDKVNYGLILKIKFNILNYLDKRKFIVKEILFISAKTKEGLGSLKKSIIDCLKFNTKKF
jgi:GTP-binding protein